MPTKNGTKTPQERAFVETYARTGDPMYSASEAGYAFPNPQAYQVLARPKIQADIARTQMEILQNEILPLAIRVHKELLEDKATPAGAKATLVKLAYDRAFGPEGSDKQPHEMTPAELAKAIDVLSAMAAEKAKPVIEAEVIKPQSDGLFD